MHATSSWLSWSPWILAALFGFAILVGGDTLRRDDPFYKHTKKKTATYWVVGLLLSGIIWNSANALFSPGTYVSHAADSQQVALKAFSFKSGAVYPLVLGSQTTAFSATSHASAGFFATTVDTTIRGGGAATVAFVHDSVTYTLALPMQSVKVVINDQVTPSMSIKLDDDITNPPVERAWSSCSWGISNLAIACKRTIEGPGDIPQKLIDTGLGKLVNEHFASAQLTMTSDMYNQLIGRIR